MHASFPAAVHACLHALFRPGQARVHPRAHQIAAPHALLAAGAASAQLAGGGGGCAVVLMAGAGKGRGGGAHVQLRLQEPVPASRLAAITFVHHRHPHPHSHRHNEPGAAADAAAAECPGLGYDLEASLHVDAAGCASWVPMATLAAGATSTPPVQPGTGSSVAAAAAAAALEWLAAGGLHAHTMWLTPPAQRERACLSHGNVTSVRIVASGGGEPTVCMPYVFLHAVA